MSAPHVSQPCAAVELILRDEIGLDASTVGSSLIERAVQRRMQTLGMAGIDRYAKRLADDAEELQELIEQVVVPETYFFREPDALNDVARRALDAHTRSDGMPLRVLSVPCSTGEEPYSIALTLLEAGLPASAIAIDAIDVSVEAVRRAEEGLYRTSSFRGDTSAWRRYFSVSAQGWRIDESVRGLVQVAHGNLLSEGFQPAREQYDVIFCRNLLIYFDERAQARALETLAALLAPEGVLVVGAADSFAARRAGFAPAAGHERTFLFRRRGATAVADTTPVTARRVSPRALPPRPAMRPLRKALPVAPAPAVETAREPIVAAVEGRAAALAMAEVSRLADAGQLNSAIEAGERAIRGGAVSAALLALIGTMYGATPQLDRAEACYRKALFLEPTNEDALLHLALLLEKRGEGALACRLRSRARRALSFHTFATQ